MISVLIVDDEKLVRDTLANYINWGELGADAVYIAENGVCALELAEKVQPSIVITDIKMPHMGGMGSIPIFLLFLLQGHYLRNRRPLFF